MLKESDAKTIYLANSQDSFVSHVLKQAHFCDPCMSESQTRAGAVALAASLLLQSAVPRYLAWVYWLVVAMIAVFGTMAADILNSIGDPDALPLSSSAC